ncbi:hypothetical protein C8J56DRAFT_905143 [Mycena floridula]|nr:hypothetical protein C8J56DRAFT_905143 [Mycena floridula]
MRREVFRLNNELDRTKENLLAAERELGTMSRELDVRKMVQSRCSALFEEEIKAQLLKLEAQIPSDEETIVGFLTPLATNLGLPPESRPCLRQVKAKALVKLRPRLPLSADQAVEEAYSGDRVISARMSNHLYPDFDHHSLEEIIRAEKIQGFISEKKEKTDRDDGGITLGRSSLGGLVDRNAFANDNHSLRYILARRRIRRRARWDVFCWEESFDVEISRLSLLGSDSSAQRQATSSAHSRPKPPLLEDFQAAFVEGVCEGNLGWDTDLHKGMCTIPVTDG